MVINYMKHIISVDEIKNLRNHMLYVYYIELQLKEFQNNKKKRFIMENSYYNIFGGPVTQ